MIGVNAKKNHSEDNSILVDMVNEYASLIHKGENVKADNVLQKICLLHKKNETPMVKDYDVNNRDLYSQVGKMTRDLHEKLNGFMNDTHLQVMTNEEMPNARQRLNHVVEITEKSAHTTMTLIEHSNPLLKMLLKKSELLQSQYDNRNTNAFSDDLSKEICGFLKLAILTSKSVSSDLNEILLAQDYQDLTGQVINRVSTLVQDVEDNLLLLLKLGNVESEAFLNTSKLTDINKRTSESKLDRNTEVIKDNRGYGPAIPGITKGEVMQSQNEVDDLLSSLGF